MSGAGYVLVPRDVMGLPVFRNEAEAGVFVLMILRAAWRDQTVRYKGHVLRLQRGQLAVSIRDLARSVDRDKAWIERLWKRLKSEALIETHTEAGVSIVTICNYDEYQQAQRGSKAAGETVGEAERETVARQSRDTEQVRETIETTEDSRGSAPDLFNHAVDGSPAGARPMAAPGSSAVDVKRAVIDRGTAMLVAQGIPEPRARSIVGKWRKDHGDGATLDAISRAEVEGPSSPLEFITGCLNHSKGLRNGHGTNGARPGAGRGTNDIARQRAERRVGMAT